MGTVCLIVLCSLSVSKFSHFSSPHPPLLKYCLLCYWPAPPSIHRGLEWPQCLNSLFDCLIVLLLTSTFIVWSPSKRQRESHKSETLKEVNEASPKNNDSLPYPKTETRVTRACDTSKPNSAVAAV